ncbi:hypothetical protein HZU77_014540, partial [Neisseriaceae bacterium TC5R-5]|nr:hypothetical protein [Neisseriaceae bacterium TC5R-5]
IKIYSETLQSHAPISINPAQSLGLSPRGTPAVAVHDERFEMLDPAGKPLSKLPYELSSPEGSHVGLVAEKGQTSSIYTPEPQNLTLGNLWAESSDTDPQEQKDG